MSEPVKVTLTAAEYHEFMRRNVEVELAHLRQQQAVDAASAKRDACYAALAQSYGELLPTQMPGSVQFDDVTHTITVLA